MLQATMPQTALLRSNVPSAGTRRSEAVMDTIVTIQIVGRRGERAGTLEDAMGRAFEWFRQVEDTCTRFDARSEVMRLTTQIGVSVPVSAVLYETIRFALAVAEDTGGAFDPTVGYEMEQRGFRREHRTGRLIRTAIATEGPVSYRDVHLTPDQAAVTLLRPLVLDLGAIAKGLAIDMAARELLMFEDFAIDAGGDLYLGGCGPDGGPWSVGIRHPRRHDKLIDSLRVSNKAVCTSGDYERRSPGEDPGHHLLDARTGMPASAAISATVIAPTAMMADALSTAAFVLGPADGIQLCHRHGVDGVIVSPTLECHTTSGTNQ